MRHIKSLGCALAALLAINAVAASAALAEPEFLKTGKTEVAKKGFTSTSGAGEMLVPKKAKITCTEDTNKGKIKGTKEVEKVTVTFKKCKGENLENKKTCEVKSTEPAGGSEEVITKELKGKLVETAVGTKVGLLLEPEKAPFVKLKGECLPVTETPVEGGIVGEVTPVGKLVKEGELIYRIEKEKQQIKTFTSGGKEEEKVLKAFSIAEAPLMSTDKIKFEEEVEVT
jgi:hypothetical protein